MANLAVAVLAILCIYASCFVEISNGHLLEITDDFCIDRAFQRWHLSMVSTFSQYAEFTSLASSSRSLFQALFTQDFTTESFKAYCKVHEDARKLYDTCQDSEAKNMANIEFALADHICIKRREIYSLYIPCLQQTNIYAFSQCRNACRTYESDARRYNNPQSGDLNNDRMNWIPYMASDCQYLRCMTLCRKPIFSQKCGEAAAALEYEALRATFAKKIDYYDPPIMRNMMKDSFVASVIFPVECQQLVDEAI